MSRHPQARSGGRKEKGRTLFVKASGLLASYRVGTRVKGDPHQVIFA